MVQLKGLSSLVDLEKNRVVGHVRRAPQMQKWQRLADLFSQYSYVSTLGVHANTNSTIVVRILQAAKEICD